MDVDSIPFGSDFVDEIDTAIAGSDVMLVIIGRYWLNTLEGDRRIDNPKDFVRLEIRSALEKKIPVIPVLVNNSKMPSSKDLPEDILPLTRRNAFSIRHDKFDVDFQELIKTIRAISEEREKRFIK